MQMIFKALPEETVDFGHAFTGYSEGADGISLAFENKPEVQAQYVIGADGYFSPMREALLQEGPPQFTVSLF